MSRNGRPRGSGAVPTFEQHGGLLGGSPRRFTRVGMLLESIYLHCWYWTRRCAAWTVTFSPSCLIATVCAGEFASYVAVFVVGQGATKGLRPPHRHLNTPENFGGFLKILRRQCVDHYLGAFLERVWSVLVTPWRGILFICWSQASQCGPRLRFDVTPSCTDTKRPCCLISRNRARDWSPTAAPAPRV